MFHSLVHSPHGVFPRFIRYANPTNNRPQHPPLHQVQFVQSASMCLPKMFATGNQIPCSCTACLTLPTHPELIHSLHLTGYFVLALALICSLWLLALPLTVCQGLLAFCSDMVSNMMWCPFPHTSAQSSPVLLRRIITFRRPRAKNFFLRLVDSKCQPFFFPRVPLDGSSLPVLLQINTFFPPLLLDVLLVVHFCLVEVPHQSLVGKPEDLVGLLVVRDWYP